MTDTMVRFVSWRLGAAALLLALIAQVGSARDISPAPKGSFSVVALPDTQAYSDRLPEVFHAETQWIIDNLQTQRIVFVSHLGDIVDKNEPRQWANAVRAMSKLDGRIRYGLAVGNHDMKCAKGDATLFSAMFPAKHFKGNSWYGGQMKDNANSYQTFEAEGLEFVILHIECNAPDSVLKWVDGVLTANADRRAIISTHMFLGPLDRPKTAEAWFSAPKGVMKWRKCHGKAGNTPAQLWQKCFAKHKNVLLILCGDQSRSQTMHMTLTGASGNRVHVCLSDYREGYLRVYRFVPDANQIRVMTYSVTKRSLCKGTTIVKDESKHQFSLPYEMAASKPVGE